MRLKWGCESTVDGKHDDDETMEEEERRREAKGRKRIWGGKKNSKED